MRRCHREIKSFSSPPRLKALNLPHSLGCRFRSHCFPGWSRGVYREARLSRVWLGSVGGLWGLLWHLWRRIRTCDFSLSKFRQKLGENMKPTLSVSTKPLKYHWHVFSSKAEIKRTEEGQRRELKQKKGSWPCDRSLWWVSALLCAWSWISFQGRPGGWRGGILCN